jgi:hypothetical protein
MIVETLQSVHLAQFTRRRIVMVSHIGSPAPTDHSQDLLIIVCRRRLARTLISSFGQALVGSSSAAADGSFGKPRIRHRQSWVVVGNDVVSSCGKVGLLNVFCYCVFCKVRMRSV